MRIVALKFQMNFNKSLVFLLGILFVFLSGCRFLHTRTSDNEEKTTSNQSNNSEIKDSVFTKSDTLNKNSNKKTDSIAPLYNPRIDAQPLYGVKPNYLKKN